MSRIPKARKSTITDLTVEPDEWDSYPVIENSVITSCKFTNLSSATRVRHSQLKDVQISPAVSLTGEKISSKANGSYIEHSTITSSELLASYIEHSDIQHCSIVQVGRIEHSTARVSEFRNCRNIERSSVIQSHISEANSDVIRSNVTKSLIKNGSQVLKSNISDSSVARSHIEKSELINCDVNDCKIKATNFKDMVLRNGIWDKGDLVGRVSRDAEVVVTSKKDVEPEKPVTAPAQHAEILDKQPNGLLNASKLSPLDANYVEATSHRAGEFTPPTPTSDGYSSGASVIDDEEDDDDRNPADSKTSATSTAAPRGLQSNYTPNDLEINPDREQPPPPYEA
ncbi:hypothetical protein FQN57_003766 [Myotisia sp. PD_48]|nr:hypothetical protein FQN57_003766 [Myotisia sp. PD_48]